MSLGTGTLTDTRGRGLAMTPGAQLPCQAVYYLADASENTGTGPDHAFWAQPYGPARDAIGALSINRRLYGAYKGHGLRRVRIVGSAPKSSRLAGLSLGHCNFSAASSGFPG